MRQIENKLIRSLKSLSQLNGRLLIAASEQMEVDSSLHWEAEGVVVTEAVAPGSGAAAEGIFCFCIVSHSYVFLANTDGSLCFSSRCCRSSRRQGNH